MSYQVSLLADKEQAIGDCRLIFNEKYPDPAPGVKEQVDSALDYVKRYITEFVDCKQVSLAITGHARQSAGEINNITITINEVPVGGSI